LKYNGAFGFSGNEKAVAKSDVLQQLIEAFCDFRNF
jgi:hypothetical protein